MTEKQFALFIKRLQVQGQSMYEESLKHKLSWLSLEEIKKLKQPSYNQWELDRIMEAVRQIEF